MAASNGLLGPYGNQGVGGLLGSQQQQPEWANTLGLISSAVKDFANNYSGRGDTDNLQNWQARGQRQQLQGALAQGFNSDDPAIRKQAAMYALSNGIDPTPWLNLTRRKVEHIGDSLVSSDQFDPADIKPIYTAPAAAPAGYDRTPDGKGLAFTPGGPADPAQAARLAGGRREPPPGMQYGTDGKTLQLMPGYAAAAGQLAGVRRAPPKPTAGGTLGNPASLFGPR